MRSLVWQGSGALCCCAVHARVVVPLWHRPLSWRWIPPFSSSHLSFLLYYLNRIKRLQSEATVTLIIILSKLFVAGARLCAKQYHLLYKFHGEAAP
jgi:hypothetical protein